MNYTTLERIKTALGALEAADDALLTEKAQSASREFDRRVTGTADGADYFTLEDVSAEILKAWVDVEGFIQVWPHKAIVNSVASLEYRRDPRYDWMAVDADDISIDGNHVTAWIEASDLRSNRPVQVRISYEGGYADDPDDLPADLIEAVTVLAVRYYRETRTGLTDSVGVAELGTLVYTKALPVRVQQTIQGYVRPVPW